MANRSSLFLGVCVVVGSLIFGLASSRTSVGQVPGVPAQAWAKTGRFQILPAGQNAIVLWDTETGATWTNQVTGTFRWNDLGSPVPPAKILRGF